MKAEYILERSKGRAGGTAQTGHHPARVLGLGHQVCMGRANFRFEYFLSAAVQLP